jgi:hypothetical protein
MAGGPRLPRHVRSLIAQAALEMGVLAEPGDRLWTPEPVDSQLPGIALETGPLAEARPADRVLAWGETQSVAALRRAGPLPCDRDSADPRAWLWSSVAAPAVARRCNHRRFSLELARELGVALPGATLVRAIDDIERLLAERAHDRSARGEWVVKAPLAAAGRDRVRRRADMIDDDARIRLGRLFELHGELVFEPWMDRIDDYGCAGVVTDAGVRLFPPHHLINNPSGVYRAIAPLERAVPELTAIARDVGHALAGASYRGPFGIDAYTYRDRTGQSRLHPLSEINARFTHGLLAALRRGDRPLD